MKKMGMRKTSVIPQYPEVLSDILVSISLICPVTLNHTRNFSMNSSYIILFFAISRYRKTKVCWTNFFSRSPPKALELSWLIVFSFNCTFPLSQKFGFASGDLPFSLLILRICCGLRGRTVNPIKICWISEPSIIIFLLFSSQIKANLFIPFIKNKSEGTVTD